MAVFSIDDRHKAHVCNPLRGKIMGKLDPSFDGPGKFVVAIEIDGGATIAQGTVESKDGSPVPCSMDHSHPNPRENVHININGKRVTSFAFPICLTK